MMRRYKRQNLDIDFYNKKNSSIKYNKNNYNDKRGWVI